MLKTGDFVKIGRGLITDQNGRDVWGKAVVESVHRGFDGKIYYMVKHHASRLPYRVYDDEIGASVIPYSAFDKMPSQLVDENRFDLLLAYYHRITVQAALSAAGGNQSKAAGMIGINRNSLAAWIKKYQVEI